jgi:SAM-dependent methyltransferase
VPRLTAALPPRAREAIFRATRPIVGRLEARRTRHMSDRERWEQALGSEVDFWKTYLGDLKSDDKTNYLRPDYAWSEEPICARVADQLPTGRVEVLDVGAGPMTAVPKVHPGRDIHITAFDPLAEQYNARLDELGIEPLVRTQKSTGEDLLQQVTEGSFDVAHASNCLDHAYDPGLAIRNMLLAVKPGGMVLLRHARNEAVNEHYVGLHQWNFDEENGDFILWRPGTRRNLSEELRDLGKGEVFMHDGEIAWLVRRL